MPDLIEKANCMMDKCIQNKKDLGDKIINNIKKQCKENCENKAEKQDKQDNSENKKDDEQDIKTEKVSKEIKIETESNEEK